MSSLSQDLIAYATLLEEGTLQRTLKGLYAFMEELQRSLHAQQPTYHCSPLYKGMFDMSYFAFTPPALKAQGLKVAVVYVHATGCFELWLAANNRTLQKQVHARLSGQSFGCFEKSILGTGVDAILHCNLATVSSCDKMEGLRLPLEQAILSGSATLVALLDVLET
ncbi:MAG: DUF7000 family protein [Erysipelotrichaceae bacterium]